MAPCFPTQFELRLSGISLIIANISWLTAWWITEIDHDLYQTATNKSVIAFHEKISTSAYRRKVEISCTLIWISFPFLLAAIHGITKFAHVRFHETKGEVLIYLFEKSYILLVGLVVVFGPALMLTITSYDWEYATISDDGTAPNGYYIQLYLMIYMIEFFDCGSILDATFTISYFSLFLYYIYVNSINWSRYCVQICFTLSCCSMCISFLLILFEFADSGFFSPNGDINAGILFIWSYGFKILIGIYFVKISQTKQYKEIKKVFGIKKYDNVGIVSQDDGKTEKYNMTTIDVTKEDDYEE